jgi:hypothetical protein
MASSQHTRIRQFVRATVVEALAPDDQAAVEELEG